MEERAARRAELEALEPIDFKTLDVRVRQWMLVADTGIIKLLPAILTANKLPGHDPIWVMLIAPPGGGKSEFLHSLIDIPDMYPISLLSPNTFLSGMKGPQDTSLLPHINGKILIFKDWTNILSQNKDGRNEVMGQLREIYDGYTKKVFGNGKVAEWHGKIGIIAGVTPAVDLASQMTSTLGERFINYRIVMPDRKAAAWRALGNGTDQEKMRKELRNAFYAYIKGITIPTELPEIPEEVKTELISVADFATMARSGVIREYSFKKEVVFVPAAEMPTRTVQALHALAMALIINNQGSYDPEDMNLIYRVALDSIPQTNYMVIKEMARGDERTTADIATSLGYPTSPVRMYLENLALLGVCKRIKGADSDDGGNADRWTLLPEFATIIRKYETVVSIAELQKVEQEKLLDEAFAYKEPEQDQMEFISEEST